MEKIIRDNRKEWMTRYGATGVGIGLKIKNGKITKEEAIIFFVPKKLKMSMLGKGIIKPIPQRLERFKTDVVEITFTTRDRPIPDDRRIRPVSGSLATINAKDKGTGTNGYVNEAGLGLSNNHVWSCASTEVLTPAEVGDIILQPGAHGGGVSPRDNALELLRWVTLKASGVPNLCIIGQGVSKGLNAISKALGRRGRFNYIYGVEEYNRVDGAVAKATVDYIAGIYKTVEPREIIKLGTPPIRQLRSGGDPRAKVGRTTGYTEGMIYATDITTQVGMYAGNVQVWFENQVSHVGEGYTKFSAPGDSGSQIYHPKELIPTELLFAGGTTGEGIDITIGNCIEDVMKELNYGYP